MDAMLALPALLLALVGFAAASLAFGVDSRDDFGDDRPRRTIVWPGHDSGPAVRRPQ